MGNELIQDMNSLLSVLIQGEEQTSQLESNLNESSTPTTLSKSLAQQLNSTLNKAISMTKLIIDSESSRKPPCPNSTASDSPRSNGGSPGSENSGRAFKELQFREMSKKRKALPKWSTKVRVSSGGAIEGTPDDGYSWRKYGQKDILGAKFPRGYYRCTHRTAQGCFAIKQVQRSDEDPSIFEISYRGAHTCLQKPRPITSTQSPQEHSMQAIHSNPPIPTDHKEGQTHPDHQLLLSFKNGLQVRTEGISQDGRRTDMDGSFAASFSSSAFFSPATSESNYCPLPPFHVSSSYGGGANDLITELDSAVTASASTSSSMADIDYMMGFQDYEPYLPFDGSSFFR